MVRKDIKENTNLKARRSPVGQEGSQPRRQPGIRPENQPGRPTMRAAARERQVLPDPSRQSHRPLTAETGQHARPRRTGVQVPSAPRALSQPPMAGAGHALRGPAPSVNGRRPEGPRSSGRALPGPFPGPIQPANGRRPEASRPEAPYVRSQPSPALPQTVRPRGRVQEARKRSAPYPHPRQNVKLSPEEELKRHKEQQRRQLVARALQHQELIFVLVLAVLTLFGLLFLFWPREAQSRNEKRVLAQAPQLTPNSYFSGDWARGVEAFYADQFPFRSRLISLNPVSYTHLTLPTSDLV